MEIDQTTLWLTAFDDPSSPNPHREELAAALKAMRKLVATLVNQIHADLPQYTVHDITHLDALWGIASEITGAGYQINPTEAFVFGAAILLHDAGMSIAAYPGGIAEIKRHPTWRKLLSRYSRDLKDPTDTEIDLATEEFLRLEHANRAMLLPFITWSGADKIERPLIENADIRPEIWPDCRRNSCKSLVGYRDPFKEIEPYCSSATPIPDQLVHRPPEARLYATRR